MSPLTSPSPNRKPTPANQQHAGKSVIPVTEIPVERTDGGAAVVCGTFDIEDF